MEYQKTMNLLDKTPNQPFKFRTKNWFEIKDDPRTRIAQILKLNLKLQC